MAHSLAYCGYVTHETFSYFPLRKRRAHEVCGPGALGFACALGANFNGPVLWISESWVADRINPDGINGFFDPHKLLLVRVADQTDMLAVAEEALRSRSVLFVVMELSKPMSLTAGRRLQLAAETGKTMALSIVPEGMGSNAAETRWYCTPLFDPEDSTLQRWELIKNKSGTLGMWDVRWDAETRRVIVVSKAAQRPGSARTPD